MSVSQMLCIYGTVQQSAHDVIIEQLHVNSHAGLIVAVGVSNLQFVDMNSSRNLFIFGFSFFTGLTVSEWMKLNPQAIDTGKYNNRTKPVNSSAFLLDI